MSRSALLIPAAVAATLAFGASSAGATTITQANACTSSSEPGQYGDLPLQLTGTGTQNGRQFDVSPIQPQVEVPSWLPEKIKPYLGAIVLVTGTGKKTINVQAWAAISGKGSTEGTQMITTTGTVQVTIGGDVFNPRISNISLSLNPTGATTWHAPDAGGTIDIAQGAAGSLPAIPAGDKGAMITPKGSLYIRGNYSNVFSLGIDCQPGKTDGDGTELRPVFSPLVPTTALSSTFEAVKATVPPVEVPPVVVPPVVTPPAVTPPATAPAPAPAPTPAPAPAPAPTTKPLAAGLLAIASPSLKFGSAAVLVNVACPAGGADCTGSATMTSAAKLKVGKGAAKVRKLASGTFSVPAGTTAPVKLKLSSDGKKLRKKALVATVTLKPASGTAVVKRLRANG